MNTDRPRFWQVIRRGWAKRCPHCGQGPVFVRWMTTHGRCPVCGYVYERDYGEAWGFWIVTDRIPLAVGIVAVYFGFRLTSFWVGVAFLAVMFVPLIWTMPRRYSLAIALSYLGRRKWPDHPDDVRLDREAGVGDQGSGAKDRASRYSARRTTMGASFGLSGTT